ncbi:hypothetical protein B0H13DRAFT_2527755, partial [Mycena leptocephala]
MGVYHFLAHHALCYCAVAAEATDRPQADYAAKSLPSAVWEHCERKGRSGHSAQTSLTISGGGVRSLGMAMVTRGRLRKINEIWLQCQYAHVRKRRWLYSAKDAAAVAAELYSSSRRNTYLISVSVVPAAGGDPYSEATHRFLSQSQKSAQKASSITDWDMAAPELVTGSEPTWNSQGRGIDTALNDFNDYNMRNGESDDCGYSEYCEAIQEEGGAFYQIGAELFVVNGWDPRTRTSKPAWYHL